MPTRDSDSRDARTTQARQLLVRLDADVPSDELGADGADLAIFSELLARYPDLTIRQSFPKFVHRLRVRHQGEVPVPKGQPQRRLDLFFRVTVPDPNSDLRRLLKEIRETDGVSDARLVIPASSIPPATDCGVSGLQGYHARSSDDGVDTCYAWNVTSVPPGKPDGGGAGEGVVVCVVDRDFGADHVNGATVTTELGTPPGDNDAYKQHGSKVLGILGSPGSKGRKLRGICPGATFCFSYVTDETYGIPLSTRFNEAIDDAMVHLEHAIELEQGAVLVLQAQLDAGSEGIPVSAGPVTLPIEANEDVYAALGTAASEGITVVEAAANGDAELVKIFDETTVYWDPEPGDGTSSGAIMVGGGDSASHDWLSDSNWGSRVDCQGWGHNVFAPSSPDEEPGTMSFGTNEAYDPDFGGTSAATAMVGGIVAALQGAYHAVEGEFLEPATVREMLGNADLGNADPLGRIGPFPDLYRLLCSRNICPDLFIRDDDADTGVRPLDLLLGFAAPIFSFTSPDVFVQPEKAIPTTFDAAAAVAALGYPRVDGGANHVHARVRNRGRGTDGGRVSIFWSRPSSFLHPHWWEPAGLPGSLPSTRPAGESVAHIPWDAPFEGAPEHCALIAVVSPSRGSVVEFDASMSMMEFRDLIRTRNDIAVRNVHVGFVEAGGVVWFRYHLRGRPEAASTFRLKLGTDVPAGGTLELSPDTSVTFKGAGGAFPVPSGAVTALALGNIVAEVDLGKGTEIIFDMGVKVPASTSPGTYTLTIDQNFGILHLGRCTYVIVVPPPT